MFCISNCANFISFRVKTCCWNFELVSSLKELTSAVEVLLIAKIIHIPTISRVFFFSFGPFSVRWCLRGSVIGDVDGRWMEQPPSRCCQQIAAGQRQSDNEESTAFCWWRENLPVQFLYRISSSFSVVEIHLILSPLCVWRPKCLDCFPYHWLFHGVRFSVGLTGSTILFPLRLVKCWKHSSVFDLLDI